jgi:flagellar hook-associated protein 1
MHIVERAPDAVASANLAGRWAISAGRRAMTISTAMMAGLSGLRAAQTGLSVASQNIANANTPGYVRGILNLEAATQNGAGSGVNIAGVKRAADQFLAAASYIAQGNSGAASARNDLLQRAQAVFGDPNSDTSMFATLDQFWSALEQIGIDPSSALRRADVVSGLSTTYSEIQRVGQSLQSLASEADQRIANDVSEAQDLMNRIAQLNQEIQLSKRTNADTTSTENAQSALVDRLSTLMDVRVSAVPEGGIQVRTSGGALLVGVKAATIAYTPSATPLASHGVITVNADQGIQSNLEPFLQGGEIKGLLQARDQDFPALSEALGGFAAALGDALNQVHNENASAPPVSQMIGRQTGLLATDAIGFTGAATVAVVDSSGALQERLTIDFAAKTITAEAPAASFSFAGGTIGDFTTALNAALGATSPAGAATFTNGVMSLNVAGGGGLVVQQDGAAPSDRAGRGFSQFFGLNDIVSRPTPMFFENGLQATSLHGLSAGGEITYKVSDSAGRLIAQRTISITGALAAPTATMDDVIAALNATGTGLGGFGSFALDNATGKVTFTANAGFQAELVNDSTTRGSTGVSFSALEGLSRAATAGRATDVGLNPLVAADPMRLAVGRPDLSLALGQQVIEAGDSRGSAALLAARDAARAFPGAGVLSAQTTTLANYAARLGGEAGRLATDAQRGADGAKAVASAAAGRRADLEGVSLDDELLKMTTYQNAYAAAARVIQAAQDMLDVLMSIGYK